jgi:large subunit ribosomal protein L24
MGRPRIGFRKGDTVVAIAGDERGKRGKVLSVFPERGRALVEGLNLVKKHVRKSQDNPKGGIVDREAPLHVSNLRKVASGEEKAPAKGEAKAST